MNKLLLRHWESFVSVEIIAFGDGIIVIGDLSNVDVHPNPVDDIGVNFPHFVNLWVIVVLLL